MVLADVVECPGILQVNMEENTLLWLINTMGSFQCVNIVGHINHMSKIKVL
jgi:hypothetical protein